ncbi:ATP-dependent helicase [Bradyrhizobium barranii subsp. apii]|uniref:ATP-dependent helicase n=1 Tax=Bradyrhizobium barranii TaxID=2992140 RepID=UPI001AA146EF|nr:ATP-dependent helicase [Bradyrhizobium barranii]UPT97688.1 ATP-dependent helicase [Bradyrhizobium barranii subsp. apii]
MSLTEEQLTAVNCETNLVLTACPGSGKTRTIAARLARDIDSLRGGPKAVACITYTNAAVQEIEQRLAAQLLQGDEHHFVVSTIHSFCLTEILRPFAWAVPGFVGSMRVITRDRPEFEQIAKWAAEQINLFRLTSRDFDAFASLNLDANGNLIGAALENEPVRRAAPYFWQKCHELGFVDFANIIFMAYCLLRDNPMIARSLACRFATILIDEFQDTTELQIEILKLLHLQGRTRIFAVGDPAQSIYGFTGARPELIEPFARDIGARMDLSLSGNFRSSPPIVKHAEKLFPRNPVMISVGRYRQVEIQPILVQTLGTFQAITEQFLPLLGQHGIGFGQAAILSKEWRPLFPLSRSLREFGVPVVGPGARPYRRSRLFASLAEQLCGYIVSPGAHNIRQTERALFHAIQDATAQVRLDVFSYLGRVTLVRLLREAAHLAQSSGAAQWLDAMAQATGTILMRDGFIEAQHEWLFYASVQEMKADMHAQNIDIPNLSIEDLGLFASPERALRLMTIHSSKGREFEAVAIINLREGSFPHYRSTDIEGEKRLFYVAVTRTERVLMYVAEPDQWRNAPCRFLRGDDGVGMI